MVDLTHEEKQKIQALLDAIGNDKNKAKAIILYIVDRLIEKD